MNKTGQEIEDDVYLLLKNSNTETFIKGGIYQHGDRPYESKEEDAVIKFVAGLSDASPQTGIVVINIFTHDNKIKEGFYSKNTVRCREIEKEAKKWVDTLDTIPTDYAFYLAQTIQTFPEEAIHQHFVSIRLKYKLVT